VAQQGNGGTKAAVADAVNPVDGPPLLPHPHKVYTDTAHNKLFWPMDKQFYVRLTGSPDDNAPSFLLQRVTPESDISTEKYNKEGIALEIQGPQFIRWFNYVTKQTVNLQFFTDGAPPVTKATCSGAPTSAEGGKIYYGVGLHCSLASEDELSGVETTFLSIDDAPYKPYTKEIALDKEKPVVLRSYAVDNVGYAENPSTMRFIVDLTPPVTTHAIAGNALGTVLSTQARFHISSTDALSGVATVHARFDKQDFKLITDGQMTVEALTDGDHSLSYYAVDHVSNRETEHVIPFYVDRTPPTVESKVVGDLFLAPTGTRYISGRSKIELTAQDNKIGVDKIVYAFDGVKYDTYSNLFSPPTKAGTAKISYRASDKLGNTSQVATLPYLMDLAPPQSSYKIVGPSYQVRSDFYITSASRIALSSTDDASGVKQIQYQPEGSPQAGVYTTPLAFPDEGRRLLRYWGTDKVENRELDRALILITDNTPPDIFANFSLAPTKAGDAQNPPVYRPMTSLFLGATDNAAGVRKIFYSFDGGKEMEYSTPLVLAKDGTFDLLIRAEDNLGNQSSKHLRFVIHT
jgi:hypothetical protein